MTAVRPGPIRRLPPAVADAIAAGEVVERPASVVKELVENAIDAGARRVDVTVTGGGTTRIRVADDGGGIAAGELRLAVARHATSKIELATDLGAVRTLGFRGEALASIAAVAEVEIVSRPAGAAAAGRIVVRAASLIAEGPAAAAQGTAVEVRDLFAATPARLRFLRTERAETAACVRVAADLALCHPTVAVTCTVDGRTALRSPGGSLRDACAAVLGAAAAAELLPVVGEGEVAVGGLVSQPRAHRGTRGGVVLVVNGRRIHNRALGVAVEEAYRGLLPVARYPFGVVTVAVDPDSIDVNVHPAKREVRFREEGRVFSAVQRAVWSALATAAPYRATAVEPAPGDGGAVRFGLRLGEGAPRLWETTVSARSAETAEGFSAAASRPTSEPGGQAATIDVPPAATDGAGRGGPDRGARAAAPDRDLAGLSGLAPLRALGQTAGAWMVASSPAGVVLVDPHAAHEKVLYTELLAARRQPADGAGRSQLLLLPVIVECDAADTTRAADHADLLTALGFAVEPFGPATLRCSAVPASCGDADPATLIRDLLGGLREDAGPAAERDHRVAALVACHSAVRFGDALPPEQQQRLLDRLVATPGGMTCPHGRPTVVLLDDPTLRRAFGRPAV